MPPNFTRVHFRNHALNIKAGYSFSQRTDESQVVPSTPFEHQRDNFQLATSNSQLPKFQDQVKSTVIFSRGLRETSILGSDFEREKGTGSR